MLHSSSPMPPKENWLSSSPHDSLRSVELVRVTVAVVLLTHPLHALLHTDDVAALAQKLGEQGMPWSTGAAWLGLGVQLVAALGLFVRRFAAPAALASMAVVLVGSAILYAPRWFVLGGEAEDGQPGVEFSVLLLVALAAVAWTWRGRDRHRAAEVGLQVIAIGSALMLLPHALIAFVKLDFEGMRQWGEGMTKLGFPHGVALVWGLKSLELVSCIARLSRRLVVPACLGHLVILLPGMVISQHMDWFDVGPGEGGIEYPLILSACTIATLLAYWPRGTVAAEVRPVAE